MSARFLSLDLPASRRDRLTEALRGLQYPRSDHYEPFLRAAGDAVRHHLPHDWRNHLEGQRLDPDPTGVTLLRGLPQDPSLPATPPDGRRSPDKSHSISEAVLLGIASLLGEPYAYRVEKETLVHDVCPTSNSSRALTNEGSRQSLGRHTELAYFSTPPRRLILTGLRQDHDQVARTPVSDIRDALPLLDEDALHQLRLPQFRFRAPYIFDGGLAPHRRRSEPRPVLTGTLERPSLRVALYGDLTESMRPEGDEALQRLDEAFAEVQRDLTITPGSMVILDNQLVVHARSRFQPRFDGQDRWLQRVHVADGLWPHRHHQSSAPRLLEL